MEDLNIKESFQRENLMEKANYIVKIALLYIMTLFGMKETFLMERFMAKVNL